MSRETCIISQDILRDPSYESTYSAIHANHSINERQEDSAGSYFQRKHNQNTDLQRRDVVAIQYLSTAMPNKGINKDQRLSEQRNLNLPAGSTYSSTEAVEYVYGSNLDEISDWQGPCKRFQGIKRAQRPPPYYIDPVSGPIKTRSSSVPPHRREGTSIYQNPYHNPQPKAKVLRDSITDLSVGNDISHSQSSKNRDDSSAYSYSSGYNRDTNGPFVNGKSKNNPISSRNENQEDVDKETKSNSLYSSIIELADDNSYEAHFDRIKSSKIGQNEGHETDLEKPDRHYKNSKKSARFTSSQNVQAVLSSPKLNHDDVESFSSGKRNSYTSKSFIYRNDNNEKNKNRIPNDDVKKDQIKNTELSILNHLSGRIGGLRNHLQKMDISNSGVLNFSEFRTSIAQLGVEVSQSDLFAVYVNAANDHIGKGSMNVHETYGHDARYTNGTALDIVKYTERLAESVIRGELEKGMGKKECHDVERRRAMKKVLHASNKQSDPMKIFHYIAQNQSRNQNKNVNNIATFGNSRNGNSNDENNAILNSDLDHLSPDELKDGIQSWGSNLSDKEFNYLLEKVSTSYDGKISLSELDNILHASVGEYDENYNTRKKELRKTNKRYSKTYQSCRTINSHCEAEYDKLLDNNTGKKDKMEMYKLKGIIQENCHNLPDAFKNAVLQMDQSRGRTMDQNSRNLNHRRSSSLGSTKNYSGIGSRSMGTEVDEEVTTSGRYYGKERQNRERDNLLFSSNELQLPINRLKDVLSDAGVQLGTDDARRLSGLIARGVSSSFASHTGTNDLYYNKCQNVCVNIKFNIIDDQITLNEKHFFHF